MHRTQLVGLAAIALVASGCSSSGTSTADEGPSAPPATPSTTLSVPAAPSQSPSAAEPNVGDRALRVGETREGLAQRTTLHEIKAPMQAAEYREPSAGNQFVGLRVTQCIRPAEELAPEHLEGDTYSTYNGEWYAVSPSGNQVAGNGSSYTDWPTPKFPESVTMLPGDCLKGWIAVEVPSGMKIEKFIWRPGGQTTAEWLP